MNDSLRQQLEAAGQGHLPRLLEQLAAPRAGNWKRSCESWTWT